MTTNPTVYLHNNLLLGDDPKENLRVMNKHYMSLPSNWRPWLPEDPSAAFLVCVGAGPWKFGRRQKVQRDLLEFYAKHCACGPDDLRVPYYTHDLAMLRAKHLIGGRSYPLRPAFAHILSVENHLPLEWQAEVIQQMISYCTPYQSMYDVVKSSNPSRYNFGDMISSRGGRPYKVVSLFLRDYLGHRRPNVRAFPVDRHVARTLKAFRLPEKERDMINLCEATGIDCIELSRRMGTEKLDTGNPDWTEWRV